MAGLAGESGDEADAAGVVLVAWVVHPLLYRMGRSTHRLSRRRLGVWWFRGTTLALACGKLSCRLHGVPVPGKRILVSTIRTWRGDAVPELAGYARRKLKIDVGAPIADVRTHARRQPTETRRKQSSPLSTPAGGGACAPEG